MCWCAVKKLLTHSLNMFRTPILANILRQYGCFSCFLSNALVLGTKELFLNARCLVFFVCIIAGAGEQLQCSDADNRKGIQSVKRWMLVCLWWWFDWSFARAPVVTSTSIILSCNKIHPEWRHSGIGLQGLSWEMTVKRVTSYRIFRKFANPIPVGFFLLISCLPMQLLTSGYSEFVAIRTMLCVFICRFWFVFFYLFFFICLCPHSFVFP